jgi:hypothetical protein
MKKIYEKPVMLAEVFVPNMYVAACDQSGATQTYYFMCDGGFQSGQYDVVMDSNGNQTLEGVWRWNFARQTYQWGYSDNGERDNLLTAGKYFHPCNKKHTVTVPYGTSVEDIFPHGWMQTKDSHSNTDWTAVRIWRGENNDNIHCTTNLRSEDFIPHNPS